MTSIKKVIKWEVIGLIIFIITFVIIEKVFNIQLFEETDISEALNNNLLNLNSAVVIALLISLVSNKVFIEGKRHFRKIARNTTALVIINSTIMAISCVFGWYGTILVLVTFIGNMYKFYDISKNMLEIF